MIPFWTKVKNIFRAIFRRLPSQEELQSGHRLTDIAEELGMFPTEVEKAVRDLQEKGKVDVYWYEGEMWVVYKDENAKEEMYNSMYA